MGDGGRGYFKGCALGCGAVFLIGIGLIVIGTVSVTAPLRRAEVQRGELDKRFGAQEEYTPSADGSLAPERVEAFLAVRGALADTCASFAKAEEEFHKIEAFDEQENPSKIEVMSQAMKTSRAAIGIGPLLGELFETRNSTLFDQEMGLGEYTYIYLVAYHDLLNDPEGEDSLIFDGPVLNHRLREAVGEMLARQRALLDDQEPSNAELREALLLEIEALDEDRYRVPWQEGLPPSIAASLAPYEDRLEGTFCRTTASTALLQNRRRALAIESY